VRITGKVDKVEKIGDSLSDQAHGITSTK